MNDSQNKEKIWHLIEKNKTVDYLSKMPVCFDHLLSLISNLLLRVDIFTYHFLLCFYSPKNKQTEAV